MKHIMRFEIINPVVGEFVNEFDGWEQAQLLANGSEVRLVQSRQIDQDRSEVKDLRDSRNDTITQDADSGVIAWNFGIFLLAIGFISGVLACAYYMRLDV